jgi:hypothetical protein
MKSQIRFLAFSVFLLSSVFFVNSVNGQVNFTYDETRVSNITVNGQSILGTPVSTGGIYLIGSLDGSDAQGRSVGSIGATGGYLNSDSPSIPRPRYQLRFSRIDPNRLRFYAEVGPMPATFTTISMPFDFGKQVVQNFSFNGTQYTQECSLNNGIYTQNGATYNSIRPACEIRNINGVLLGKVGVARTLRPTSWGEVRGSIATVRVNITRSSHYRSMEFYNHFGTNNLELGFGRMDVGETAFVEGEIIVTPNNSTLLTFQAESNLSHQIGRQDGDGWSVNVRDTPSRYMCYGPYTTSVPSGNRTATYRMLLDNVTADNNRILTLDVYNATTGVVLARRDVRRLEFSSAFTYQDFTLNFNAPSGNQLEFRTFWHGSSYAKQDKVTIR